LDHILYGFLGPARGDWRSRICHWIVAADRGSITAADRGAGLGAVFSIRLPAADEARAAYVQAVTSTGARSIER
jgi:hypothetical protein